MTQMSTEGRWEIELDKRFEHAEEDASWLFDEFDPQEGDE